METPRSSRKLNWPAVLAEFHRSRLTHVQFCPARGLSIHAFRRQLYRLRVGLPPRRPRGDSTPPISPAAPAATVRPAFLPVHVLPAYLVVSAPNAAPAAHFELVLGGRRTLRVPAGFDADSLDRLLDILEARPWSRFLFATDIRTTLARGSTKPRDSTRLTPSGPRAGSRAQAVGGRD